MVFLCIEVRTMKQINIPFQLGMEYENWEFDLEILPDRLEGYDSYLWIGNKVNKFLNFTPYRTELIFYWDRLEVVIIGFNYKSLNYYKMLNNTIQNKFSNFTTETNSDHIIYKFITEKVNYWTIYFIPTKKIKIIYFSKEFPFIGKILK